MNYNSNEKKVFNGYGKDFGSKTSEKKPLRYSQDSFVRELRGKTLTIELVNGKILRGKLLELGMFDVMIELKSVENFIVSGQTLTKDVVKNLIILKSAILTVEVVKQ